MIKKSLQIVFYFTLFGNLFSQTLEPLWEIWKYEHGVTIEEFQTENEKVNYYITWASSAGIAWNHDIFNKVITFDEFGNVVTIKEEQNYVSVWEAQEPVSTSINSKSDIIFTVFEDGSDSNIPNEAVNIHGQIHRSDGTIIKKNFLIAGGADAQHSPVSCHLNNKFLAIYGDDNLGDNGVGAIKIKVFDDLSGDSLQSYNLTPLTEYHWWPVVESTSNQKRALCVWIKDIADIYSSIIYMKNDKVISTPLKRIMKNTQFVNHQLNWLEEIERFAVIAKMKSQNKSLITLVDTLGNVTLNETVSCAVFQEAKPAVKWNDKNESYIYIFPTEKNNLSVLSISKDSITFVKKIIGDSNSDLQSYQWKETGIWSKFVVDTLGNDTWNNQHIILFAMGNYSTDGVHLIPVHIDKDILTDVKEDKTIVKNFNLFQNFPNPFNPTTTIKYSILNVGDDNFSLVQLKIFDLLGREVTTLVNKEQSSGNYQVQWDGRNKDRVKVSSGIYFYRIEVDSFIKTKEMLFLQ